jgi:hypothetical protein
MRITIEISGGALRHFKLFNRYDDMFGTMTRGISFCFAGLLFVFEIKTNR